MHYIPSILKVADSCLWETYWNVPELKIHTYVFVCMDELNNKFYNLHLENRLYFMLTLSSKMAQKNKKIKKI